MNMKGGHVILFGFVVLQMAFFSAKSEAHSPSPAEGYKPARSYIVYLSEPTTKGECPKERCLRILSSVFPSKKAAEEALIYAYNVIPGFAATMTFHQATLLKEQAEVVNVVRDKMYHLDLVKGNGRFTQPELGE
ncbi:subtilisin-like protease SBT3.4 [Primulina eburnea]|uniref:subtilisin-like protease SBT3.4 n=1 Tax=Primulina eburnea TaxID=1245227 RepID=UPI003C6C3698